MKRLLIPLLVLLSVTACSTTKTANQPVTVVSTVQREVVSIPDDMFIHCPMATPPAKDKFIALSTLDEVREILVVYALKLEENVVYCDNQLQAVKQLQDNLKKNITEAGK